MYTDDVKKYKDFMKEVANVNIKADDVFGTVITYFVKYILELENGIEILIGKKSSLGMTYVIRGQYEMLLQLNYLLDNDLKTATQRARYYMYYCLCQRIRWANSKGVGKKEDADEAKELISKEYPDIDNEVNNGKGKKNNWFSLFSEYKHFNDLEVLFNGTKELEDDENSLYDYLSRICHGRNIIKDYTPGVDATLFQTLIKTSICIKKELVDKLKRFASCHNIDVGKI